MFFCAELHHHALQLQLLGLCYVRYEPTMPRACFSSSVKAVDLFNDGSQQCNSILGGGCHNNYLPSFLVLCDLAGEDLVGNFLRLICHAHDPASGGESVDRYELACLKINLGEPGRKDSLAKGWVALECP